MIVSKLDNTGRALHGISLVASARRLRRAPPPLVDLPPGRRPPPLLLLPSALVGALVLDAQRRGRVGPPGSGLGSPSGSGEASGKG